MPEAFPECNPSRSAPVRALDTIYQNTTGKSILVIVSLSTVPSLPTNSQEVQAQIGATSPPATIVAQTGVATAILSFDLWLPISFLVPNNWYYRITNVGNINLVLLNWEEIRF